MQFSESWLRQFVNPDLDTLLLANLLTMAGIEVESFRTVSYSFEGVVIGLVEKVKSHPNADRLRICDVNVGEHGLLQVVCGAKNVQEGLKVPCALIGATLPSKLSASEPFRIKLGKLRGIESFGMLCSAQELNINDRQEEGIMLLPDDAPIGLDLRKYLSNSDPIFNVKLTPNRSDCLSVFGIAREISTLTRAELKNSSKGYPIFKSKMRNSSYEELSMNLIDTDILSADLCGRFCSRVILGVDSCTPTPDWIVQRLVSAGQKSISILVDISNYLLIEYGIPSHIYDLDKIHGPLVARWAKKKEVLTLLNGETIALDDDIGIVADKNGPLALAGIMGGKASAVSSQTKNIVIEVAFWRPNAIRGRSKRYKLFTEAGYRFERGVDFSLSSEFLTYLSEFIVSLCGGKLAPVSEKITQLPVREKIIFRPLQLQRHIGVCLPKIESDDILNRLNFLVEDRQFVSSDEEKNDLVSFSQEITPPTYRFDIQEEIDVIGELARIYGFGLIPATLPKIISYPSVQFLDELDIHFFRTRMAMIGYNETINYSFVDRQDELNLMSNPELISLLNPISSEMAVMRSTLFPGLLKVLQYNLNRALPRILAFEVGRVFRPLYNKKQKLSNDNLSLIDQPMMLGGIAYGSVCQEQWGYLSREIDFFDVKGDIESLLSPFHARGMLSFISSVTNQLPPCLHPGRSALICIENNVIGLIGELHPAYLEKYDLLTAPILFQISIDSLPKINQPKLEKISRYPAVRRDLALVVDKKITEKQIKDALLFEAKNTLLIVRDISLFDVFVFDEKIVDQTLYGKKSLAFSILIQDNDKTLSETVIDDVINRLVKVAEMKCGAILRQ